ncbi:hypothetical protein B0H14DRAFT_2691049 [Mycena olivaceomarginata]|nr:hypothetical protein B0H14DRAFT_2691049 [Mycena olivaceomarginata]
MTFKPTGGRSASRIHLLSLSYFRLPRLTALPVAPRDQWRGRYLILPSTPLPNHPKIALLMGSASLARLRDRRALHSFIVGLAWRHSTDGSAGSVAGCVFGIAGTVLSIGSAFKAAQSAGWARHDDLMSRVLGDFSREPIERSAPAWLPSFRFTHPKYGLMDIVSATTPTRPLHGLVRGAKHALLGSASRSSTRRSAPTCSRRALTGASRPKTPAADFNAASGYQQIENTIQCFGPGTWEAGNVLSAQMFDNSAQETFAFASMGVFADDSTDGTLEAFTPRGMPFSFS